MKRTAALQLLLSRSHVHTPCLCRCRRRRRRAEAQALTPVEGVRIAVVWEEKHLEALSLTSPPPSSQAAERARELERKYQMRRGHVPHISISDDNHHVTEAIGDLYGGDSDTDSPKRSSRPLSFLPDSISDDTCTAISSVALLVAWALISIAYYGVFVYLPAGAA